MELLPKGQIEGPKFWAKSEILSKFRLILEEYVRKLTKLSAIPWFTSKCTWA